MPDREEWDRQEQRFKEIQPRDLLRLDYWNGEGAVAGGMTSLVGKRLEAEIVAAGFLLGASSDQEARQAWLRELLQRHIGYEHGDVLRISIDGSAAQMAYTGTIYDPVGASMLLCIQLANETSNAAQELPDLLRRVRKASDTKLNDWCRDHGFSRSQVSEFLKHGCDSRVGADTQHAIECAILQDAQRLSLI